MHETGASEGAVHHMDSYESMTNNIHSTNNKMPQGEARVAAGRVNSQPKPVTYVPILISITVTLGV